MKKLFISVFIMAVSLLIIGGCIPIYPPIYTPTPPPWNTPTPPPWATPTPTTPIPTPTPTPTQGPSIAKWTFMVYIDGDNNLEKMAVGDLNEMEMVGSTSSVNIVAQIDRIPGYLLASSADDDTSNGDWTDTRRFYVTKDYDPYTIGSTMVQDLGEVNMGDPQNIVDFVRWAKNNYPAEHYALIIWNHGGGFRKSISFLKNKDIALDETNSDVITMPELSSALSQVKALLGKKIDLVGMDACLMGMIEVAYEIKDYGNIMVASEESEPFEGWPYDRLLTALTSNPNMSASSLGAAIVNNFVNYYAGSDSVTLSAIDLTKIGALANAVSQLAHAIINDNLSYYMTYIDDADNAQYYNGDKNFIDLYDFAVEITNDSSVLDPNVKSNAASVISLVSNAVIAKGATFIGENHGLSIYFPRNEASVDPKYAVTKFAHDTYWDEMLHYLGF